MRFGRSDPHTDELLVFLSCEEVFIMLLFSRMRPLSSTPNFNLSDMTNILKMSILKIMANSTEDSWNSYRTLEPQYYQKKNWMSSTKRLGVWRKSIVQPPSALKTYRTVVMMKSWRWIQVSKVLWVHTLTIKEFFFRYWKNPFRITWLRWIASCMEGMACE